MVAELYKFRGSHYDIGVQHGTALKSVINDSVVPFVFDDYTELKISADDIVKITKEYEQLIGNSHPEIMEETRGIADGAGLSYEKALAVLLFWEVRDTVAYSFPECSSFVATGDATVDGIPIATQNSDWPLTMIGRGLGQSFHIEPQGRFSFIGRGLAGNLGRPSVVGFNEKGLAFVGSGIRQLRGAGVGFPSLTATRIGLETCETVDDFISLCRSIPHWSHAGENVDVLDKEGNVARISFQTDRIMTVQTKDHFMVSTNHYHNKEMRLFGPPSREVYTSSYDRYDRIVKLLWENYGKLDLDKVKEIMSDHEHGDKPPEGVRSVCRHGEKTQTLTNMIQLPSKGEFWIAEGPPCLKNYSSYKL
ncbi:MAG: C45 family peptidase [Candidatus Thorarchaeota archaeon]